MKIKKPYIIAETAYSFEGDVEYLLEQTTSLPAGVSAIKYHMMLNVDEYMDSNHALFKLIKKWLLTKDEWKRVLYCANSKALDVIVLADDVESICFLDGMSEYVSGIEIHAACVNDKCLLDKAINFAKQNEKKLYIGISGFEIQEIEDVIDYIKGKGFYDLILMYGFQNYPTKIEEIRLAKIPVIREMFDLPVGYADHTKYDDPQKQELISCAYDLGAYIQEIHYVKEKDDNRTDAITALTSFGLHEVFTKLNERYIMYGEVDFRLNEGEMAYLNIRKVPVYNGYFNAGHIISETDIIYKRIERPSYQHKFNEEACFIGRKLKSYVKEGTEVKIEDYL